MDTRGELGAFLRAKRAQVRPEELGLPTYGGRRRVPGLRREELAQLAGVSAGYYTRLEQGQSPNASDAVLDAVARVLFLDQHTRELYEDWHGKTHSTVADLRLIAGRYPEAPQLASLIGELSVRSPQFAQLWADHTVADCGAASRTFRHPLVGTLTLNVEFLALPDDGQRVAIHNALPGTPSEAALTLLADLAAERRTAVRAEHTAVRAEHTAARAEHMAARAEARTARQEPRTARR
ncbi:helix-turn-helix domain-containing protein [Streptomyces sp. CA-250714]|uniref:helix-turn-helix domain-containing protein n=1 Tax=Streptomyces sp. CA-250714 TaxID=3240060 RepID=UPI003D8BA72A